MSEKTETTVSRNSYLDMIKGFGCIAVVLVHFQFPGIVGKMLCSLGVSAVILFFLISGYTAKLQQDNPEKILLRIKRNSFICIYGIAVYFISSIIIHLLQNDFSKWLGTMANPVLWVRFFILGDFTIINADPLWFMPALIYGYIIIFLLDKFRITKYAYKFLPLLILLRIGMETFTNSTGTDWHLSGNFLVGALPVMLLGHYLASKREKFTQINPNHVMIFAVIALIYTFLSVSFGWKLDISQPGKILIAVSFFILSVISSEKKITGFLCKTEYIGRYLSLNVYILHFLTGNILKYIFTSLELSTVYFDYVLPVSAIVISVLISYLIHIFSKKTKA